MRPIRLALPLIAILALLALLGGCGGGDDDTTVAGAGDSETAAAGSGAGGGGEDNGAGGGGSSEKAAGQGGEAGGADGGEEGGFNAAGDEGSEAIGGGGGGQVTNSNGNGNRGGLSGSKAKRRKAKSAPPPPAGSPKALYLEAGDAACRRIREKFEAELKPYVEEGLKDALKQTDEIVHKLVVPSLEETIRELSKGIPPGDEAEIEALLAEMQDEINRAEADPHGFTTDGTAYDESDRLAKAYGFTRCGGPL